MGWKPELGDGMRVVDSMIDRYRVHDSIDGKG